MSTLMISIVIVIFIILLYVIGIFIKKYGFKSSKEINRHVEPRDIEAIHFFDKAKILDKFTENVDYKDRSITVERYLLVLVNDEQIHKVKVYDENYQKLKVNELIEYKK